MTLYLLLGALLPLLAGLLLPLAPGASQHPGAGPEEFAPGLRRAAPWILLSALVFSLGQWALNGGWQPWPSDVKHWLVHLALLGGLLAFLPAKTAAHLMILLVAAMMPLLARPYILHTWEGGLRWQAPLAAVVTAVIWLFVVSREPKQPEAGGPGTLSVIRSLLPAAAACTLLAVLIALSGSVKVGQLAGVLAALVGGLLLGSLAFRRPAGIPGSWLFMLLFLPLVWIGLLYARLPLWTALALLIAPLLRRLFPAARTLSREVLLQLPGLVLLAGALVEAILRFRAAALAPPY